jgi:hypothetical protein
MVGASSSADGETGMVPAPAKGKQSYFLRGDGTWQSITTNTVKQNHCTTNAYYPLLFRYSSGTNATAKTEQTYFNTNIFVNPSNGGVFAEYFESTGEIYGDIITAISEFFIGETTGMSASLASNALYMTDAANDSEVSVTSQAIDFGPLGNIFSITKGKPSGTDEVKAAWKTRLGIDTIVNANGVSY